MKSILIWLGVMVTGLMILGSVEVPRADWKLYSETDFFSSYYDKESIHRPSKNMIRVWVKEVNTEKGIMEMVNHLGEKYKDCDHIKKLYEVHCAEKRFRILSSAAYSKTGEMIMSDDSPSDLMAIVPKSEGEALHKTVCR